MAIDGLWSTSKLPPIHHIGRHMWKRQWYSFLSVLFYCPTFYLQVELTQSYQIINLGLDRHRYVCKAHNFIFPWTTDVTGLFQKKALAALLWWVVNFQSVWWYGLQSHSRLWVSINSPRSTLNLVSQSVSVITHEILGCSRSSSPILNTLENKTFLKSTEFACLSACLSYAFFS